MIAEPERVAGARWISLSQGQFALVDASDFERLQGASWHAVRFGKLWYARTGAWDRGSGRKQITYMHQVLLPGVVEVDHRNRNGLDNRCANLRPSTRSQNKGNGNVYSNNTSGFTGVVPRKGRWRAYVSVKNKRRWIGTFDTVEDAVRARDAAALEAFGEFARLSAPRKEQMSEDVKEPEEKRVKVSVWLRPSFHKAARHEGIDRGMSLGELFEEAMHARVMLIKK